MKAFQIVMDENIHGMIKLIAKSKSMNIGDFISEMFTRNKDSYFNDAIFPLQQKVEEIESAIAEIKACGEQYDENTF